MIHILPLDPPECRDRPGFQGWCESGRIEKKSCQELLELGPSHHGVEGWIKVTRSKESSRTPSSFISLMVWRPGKVDLTDIQPFKMRYS